ncbi:MAG: DMT family transporter [Pseudomonadota bacterium]
MPADARPDRPFRPWVGIGWMAVTGLFFVSVTGIVRYLGSDIPAAQSAFLRYAIGLLLLLPFLGPILRADTSLRLHGLFALRGLAHGAGVVLWFYAMARIPIAEVTALNYLSPIYIAIGAAVFLGEKLAVRRIAAIVAAFVGAMIILRPGFQDLNAGQNAMIIVAPIFAVSYLLAKSVSMQSNATVVVGMLTIYVTVVLAPMAWWVWQPVSWVEIGWLTLVAVLATAGHWTMTKALAAAPLAVTQPVTFLQLVWATLLGVIAFGEAADTYVMAGGAVIIASVSFISYREWVLSRTHQTPPAMATKS